MSSLLPHRPPDIHVRRDLVFTPIQKRLSRSWVVKDPVRMNYVELGEEEYQVLQLLGENKSLQEIKEHLEDKFFPAQVPIRNLHHLLAMFHRENLVVSNTAGHGDILLENKRKRTRVEKFSSFGNILAIRFRGLNPDPTLRRIAPWVRWMFTTLGFCAGILMIVIALIEGVVHFEALQQEAILLADAISLRTWLWLALAFASAKMLHELAHGLTCRHFGGTCHELGLMILAFTPCLYCNVSDAWTFRNKWHRIAVSLAGIYIELLLAAACTFLWLFSAPGLLHDACLYLILVCCVSTIVVNGNPLMKYDGYYALSDLLAVSNLHQQAGQTVQELAVRFFFGVSIIPERSLPKRRRWAFALFWLASQIYRVLVVALILWYVHRVSSRNGLASVGTSIALLVVSMLAGMAIFKWSRILRHLNLSGGNGSRAAILAAVLLLLGIGIVLLPIPAWVEVPAVLWPSDAQNVYVSVSGSIGWSVEEGDRVQKGERIAVLKNLRLQQQLQVLEGRCELQRIRVQNLVRIRPKHESFGHSLPAARELLTSLETQVAQLQREVGRLVITSPTSGVILAPPKMLLHDSNDHLITWQGSPLEQSNREAFLETGTLLCHVGSPDSCGAVLAIEEADAQRVKKGQHVAMHLRSHGLPQLLGTLDELTLTDAHESDNLTNYLTLTSTESALPVQYRARINFLATPKNLTSGMCGTARIRLPSQSLFGRLLDFLSATFRFSNS